MDQPESYWTTTANIVIERPYGPGDLEIRRGTKHFAPGAKVYIIDLYGGMCENIVVIGQHRKSKRLIKLVVDVRLVENLRAKVCYAPAVIEKIKEHYSPTRILWLTQEFAENVCQIIPEWQAAFKEKPSALQNIQYAAPEPTRSMSFSFRLLQDIRRFLNS